jgi:type I restriction enzyme R subunit
MYVDKKLAGVECVQTLSRLNRTYPGKDITGTYVLDFFNEPEEVLAAFQEYYQTAELIDVSNPNLVFDLSEKIRAFGIFTWAEVERFCEAFLKKTMSNAAVANICKPAVDRWTARYKSATEAHKMALEMFERAKKSGDAVLIANTDQTLKQCTTEKDALELFKKDLGTFVRFYEFISQIVDYDDKDLEKLSIYARQLGPLLREANIDEDELDLGDIALSHYRLSKIKQQNLKLASDAAEGLQPGSGLGSGKARDKQEEFLSQIIERLNEVFAGDGLTESDMLSYARTIKEKVKENQKVIAQIANNTREQALLGDFPGAVEEAILNSNEAQQKQMMTLLSKSDKFGQFMNTIYDLMQNDAGN